MVWVVEKLTKTQQYYWAIKDRFVIYIDKNEVNLYKMVKNFNELKEFIATFNLEQTFRKRPPIKRNQDFITIFAFEVRKKLENKNRFDEYLFWEFISNICVKHFPDVSADYCIMHSM